MRSDDKQGVEKKLPLVDDDDGWPESGTRVGAKGDLVHTPLFLFSGSMIVLRMYMRLFFRAFFLSRTSYGSRTQIVVSIRI